MNITIFDFDDYRSFLHQYLTHDGWGVKSRWAEAMTCQRAYVSKVLKGHADFSLDQAWALADHLGLRSDETDYFLNLIQFERAGNRELKSHFLNKLKKLKADNLVLSKKFSSEKELSPESLATFYSSWHYTAIHLYLAMKGLKPNALIAQDLKISVDTVNSVVDFLFKTGLIAKDPKSNQLKTDFKSTFLPRTSPFIINHHMNWRSKSISTIQENSVENIHYSAIVSLTKDDVVKIKQILVNSIADFRKIMTSTSNETEMHFLTIDFAKLL